LSVIVIPVPVQGDNAAPEIEFALLRANQLELADVIVVARGGGSLEDLAAFNSERVARAIAQSKLPVVSAVGHETDFTIADFVADLRAPTPSAAAELITEAQHRVEELIASLSHRLVRATRFQMLQSRQRLARLPIAYAQQRVVTMMHRREQHLDDLSFRMDAAIDRFVRNRLQTVTAAEAVVRKHDPRQKLSGASSTLQSFMTRIEHSTERRLQGFNQRCQTLEARLYRAAQVHTASRRAAYANIAARLQSLSPLAVLHRGYALVLDESGEVVRSIAQLTAGQTLRTRVADGSFSSQVVGFRTEEATPVSGSQISKTTLKSSRKQKGKPTSA
jgi:exodeoxyribonuclease VII large subunit